MKLDVIKFINYHSPFIISKNMSKRVKAISTNSEMIFFAKWKDFLELVKFRLNLTVVFSAVMAYLIVAQGAINWIEIGILALGGFLITGASNALNQILEKDYDALMKRTANRPVASGRMDSSEALMLAGLMSTGGVFLLAMFNVWAAFFGMVALMSYAFIYTPLKRMSPIAITVGAFPGALPMMIGAVAFEGELTLMAFGLFALQFLWQFPHFAAIGWLGQEDYQKAGYKFVISAKGGRDRSAGIHSLVYALLLIPVGFIPYYIGMTGIISAIILTILALIYAWFGWNLYQKNDRKAALQLMFSSFFYLPIALFALFFDKL